MSFGTLLLFLCTFLSGLDTFQLRHEAPLAEAEKPVTPPVPAVEAAQVTRSLAVDGRLDEADWAAAIPIAGFTQFEPVEGGAPSQQTTVRVLYGDNALYVGAVLRDSEPDEVVQTLSRRDEPSLVDRFWVAIDSYLDRKTAYVFGISAAGVQIDGVQIDGQRMRRSGRVSTVSEQVDLSWDAVWNADVALTAEGWTVEMRIPYTMLRFSEAEEQTWGVNFRREIARLSEVDDWVMVPRQEDGSVRHFGLLRGLRGIRPLRNVQVTPYSLSRMTTQEAGSGGVAYDGGLNVGADLKLGLSSNVTLDATINPDFGQVEADPAELNLTTIETFFPEKRSFFIEGVQIFDYNLGIGSEGNLLYTRRVGVAASPIIGATKLSGRTDGGLSFGMFSAVTGTSFDPGRYYGVARFKQEFGGQSSYVGGMLTGYQRQGEGGAERRSLAGGMDWDLRSPQNTYQLNGHLTLTSIAQPEADVQRQTGFGTLVTLERLRGSLTWMTAFRIFDDQFNPNDLGRLLVNDWMRVTGNVSYLINGNQPFGPFRRASVRVFVNPTWTYRSRTFLGTSFYVFGTAETRGFQRISFYSLDSRFGGSDVRETRGLGPYKNPGRLNLYTSIATDSRRSYGLEPGISFSQTGADGQSWGVNLTGSWDASARLSLSGRFGLEVANDVPAWASNEAFALLDGRWHIGSSNQDPDLQEPGGFSTVEDLSEILVQRVPAEQAGRYYVPIFGDRDTRSLDVTLRSNVTFTRTMSLQLYTQLFAAKGRYSRYRILTSPSEAVPYAAYPKRHDFALNVFNTNLVFRWEYRPGSTFFLVWSQGRQGDYADTFPLEGRSPYALSTADRLFDTFSIWPTNVFMIKMNYLLMR
ncbi:MAG: DUF5916 domain-containing protein [Rhodothermales bacterium]